MRTEPRPAFATPEAEEAWDRAGAQADWKASPEEVLDLVDAALERHGLEVVLTETGTDAYAWRIEPRSK